jgi:hypothetical protein
MSNEYRREDLSKDLFLMVKAGVLDVNIREDGEWVYSVTEKGKIMTDDEKLEVLMNLETYEDSEWELDGNQ